MFLKHILIAIEKIERFSLDKTFDDLAEDELLQDGLIRETEVVGEAVSKLESTFCEQYPDMFWSEIVATRNNLIHEYWDVDLEKLWHTVQVDIPDLKKRIDMILLELEEDDPSGE